MSDGFNPTPLETFQKISNPNYPFGEVIQLPDVQEAPFVSFFSVIESRESIRQFFKADLQQLSNLLWYACRVKKVSLSDEYNILTHRPYPSAGAIHPIDLFISLPTDLNIRNLYYYNPFNHTLIKLEVDTQFLLNFFQLINSNLNLDNAILIWLIADFQRTKAKYSNPESLIWRDAGAVLLNIQLVAKAINLNSCFLGSLGQPHISQMFPDNLSLVSAGGILIGK